ncbi:MAG TPA: tetratricopeptide repeat protein, partial [Candidatus Omnitrophota bacterium]|nr:tetratricopeptide repeat protein [Candidatus Omnitrophota bacterium]
PGHWNKLVTGDPRTLKRAGVFSEQREGFVKAPSNRPTFDHPFLLGALVISAAILALYSVALGHNFLFDEENIILNNPLIRDFSRIPEMFKSGYFYFGSLEAPDWQQYYRPLTVLTFAIDRHFWFYDPFGYNLTNILLHSVVSILLFYFLWRLTASGAAAFLSALLYCVHTLHTEAVTYTASRGDLLGGLFLVLVLIFYQKGRIGIAALFFALSLFCKESAILTPIYLLVFELAVLGSPPRKIVSRLALFLFIAAAYFYFRATYVPVPMGPPTFDLTVKLLRVLSMGPPLLNYWKALLWPEPFKFAESVRFAENFNDPVIGITLVVAGLFGVLWALAARRKGPAAFGATLLVLAMGPYLHWIHFFPEWAEHYLYIPSIGLAVLLAVFFRRVLSGDRRILAAVMAVYIFFFCLFCLRTWQRNRAYDDPRVFYTLLAQSDSPYAHYGYQNLARLDIEIGQWDEAIVPLRTAEKIDPSSYITQNLLGVYYFHKKDWERAADHFEKAYRASNDNLLYFLNVATAHIQSGKYRRAAEILESIQKKRPRYAAVYANLIAAYELSGEPGRAAEWAQVGIEQLSDSPSEAAVLAMAFVRLAFRQGWDDRMYAQMERIVTDYPEVSWYREIVLTMQGKTSIEDFEAHRRFTFGHFGPPSEMYVLVSLAMQKRWQELASFFEAHREEIVKQAGVHPLQEKELERVRELCRQNGVSLNI